MDINWSKIFFATDFYRRLSKMAQTTIIDDVVAEEAVTFVINKISENNWERCQSYSGRSAPETFLQSVCSNLIIDFHRKVYGGERPPEWLKKRQNLGNRLERDLLGAAPS